MTARVSMLLKSRASVTCFRACLLTCQAKNLSAPRGVGIAPNLDLTICERKNEINPLTPNDPSRGHTAPLTSEVAFYIFIQQI